MEVGMGQSLDLLAVGALAARIAVVAVAAAEVLHVSHRERQRTGTGLTRKQLGMADPTGVDRLGQMPFEFLLSYDVCKPHFC